MALHAHPESSRRGRAPRGPWLRASAIAGLACSGAASAQTPSFTSSCDLTIAPSWSELGGNSNGILEPGESAVITIAVSVTNQLGIATFSPPQGTYTSGTILGHGSGFFDLNGTGGTQGVYNLSDPPNTGPSGYGMLQGWRIVGPASNGSVNATGTGITQIQYGQFPSSSAAVNTANPVATMYRCLWTPASYTSRTITFQVSPIGTNAGAVWIQLDTTSIVGVYVRLERTFLRGVNIPIAPAPASFAALLLAPLPRRRRREAPP
jgi:hypothetical protein